MKKIHTHLQQASNDDVKKLAAYEDTPKPQQEDESKLNLSLRLVEGNLYPDENISYTDVDQGMIGNCYLACVASSIAHAKPEIIKDRVRDSEWKDGTGKNRTFYDVDFFDLYGDQSEAEFMGREELVHEVELKYKNKKMVASGYLPIQKESDTVDWDISLAYLALRSKKTGYTTSDLASLLEHPLSEKSRTPIKFRAKFNERDKSNYKLDFKTGEFLFEIPPKLTLEDKSTKTELNMATYNLVITYKIKRMNYVTEIETPCEKKTVTVDNQFWHTKTANGYDPVYGEDNEQGEECGTDNDKKDLWWPVLEKAYAAFVTRNPTYLNSNTIKYGYDAIGNGGYIHYAQAILLNQTPRVYFPDYMTLDDLYSFLARYSAGEAGKGRYITNYGTISSQEQIDKEVKKAGQDHLLGTVVAGHAYSLHKVYVSDDNELYAECRNPWGNNGVYGEESYPAESTDGVFDIPLSLFQKTAAYCCSVYCGYSKKRVFIPEPKY